MFITSQLICQLPLCLTAPHQCSQSQSLILLIIMDAQPTPGLELRNLYTRDAPTRENHHDDEYLNKLKELGVECHDSLSPAYFPLKNGLEYPGIKTETLIKSDEVLMRVPERLILSSMKALKEPGLQDVYEHQFYKQQNCWQDRVLLTYCLYLISSKSTSSIFYDMINHMSKEIDVAFCWPESQLDIFIDRTVKNAALLDRKSFEEEWADFQKVQQLYPVLQAPEFTKANYQWIFIHITSRCFGKAMDYTSFVPFCQFFNHHSSSVYYEINTPKPSPQPISQAQDDLSSNGSHSSQDYLEEGEFAYDEIEAVAYKWGENPCLDLDAKERMGVVALVKRIVEKAELEVDWKDFSILFLGHFLMRVKVVENQYIEGRKNAQLTLKTLNSLSEILNKYMVYTTQFYTLKQKKPYKYPLPTPPASPEFQRPSPESYKPTYTHFHLKTSKSDIFQPNNQVYFCYGPNSNRTLLLRYGFAIQGNKYQHFWLSYSIEGLIREMPVLMDQVMEMGLSLRRKFKINYTRLNLDLIVFFRLNSWNLYSIGSLDQIFYVTDLDRQQLILQQIIDSLSEYLQPYTECSFEDLLDKQLAYHQYFAKLYNLEKKRILQKQIMLFGKLVRVLSKLADGVALEQATNQLTPAQKYMCRQYLQLIVL